MSWVPIDTRLLDHPKVLRLAVHRDRHQVVGLLAHLWGLLHDLETELLDGTAEELEQLYGWPEGWLRELERVGWAIIKGDSIRFPTRNWQKSDKRSKRSEAASKAANARWDATRRSASKRIPNASNSASCDASCGSDAAMPQIDREISRDASTHAPSEGGGSVERPIRIADIRRSMRAIGQ